MSSVSTTHMEIWVSKHTRETCYLQVRDGQVWGCWIGRKGLSFRSLDQARVYLLSIGYTEVPSCGQ